jgi:hypothetical protein
LFKQKTARYIQAHVAMKFTEDLPQEIMDKSLRAEHAHVSPVPVKVTRTFNSFEFISVSISDSSVFEEVSNELLGKHKKLIDSIYHQSHVPKEHFKRLYLYSIERLAICIVLILIIFCITHI